MKDITQAYTKGNERAKTIIAEMKAGKRDHGLDFTDEVNSGKVRIAEMIGTDDGATEFISKVTVDAYQGREQIPLLYKRFYRTISDSSLPKLLEAYEFGNAQVVFLEHLEGGEVRFGQMAPGTKKVVEIKSYAAGLEFSKEMLDFNQVWNISEAAQDFGISYSKLLNHLHLAPITTATYSKAVGATLAEQKKAQEGDQAHQIGAVAQKIEFNSNITQTLQDALTVLPAGNVLLVNSADLFELHKAIKGAMYSDTSPMLIKQMFNNDNTFVVYDGETVVVGGQDYTYTGVAPGTAYLLTDSKRNFREYIKQDLQIMQETGDLSRLIATQMVGQAYRGVFAAIGGKYGAVKVELAAST